MSSFVVQSNERQNGQWVFMVEPSGNSEIDFQSHLPVVSPAADERGERDEDNRAGAGYAGKRREAHRRHDCLSDVENGNSATAGGGSAVQRGTEMVQAHGRGISSMKTGSGVASTVGESGRFVCL